MGRQTAGRTYRHDEANNRNAPILRKRLKSAVTTRLLVLKERATLAPQPYEKASLGQKSIVRGLHYNVVRELDPEDLTL